ncbi:WhiB family transcriptional regulator [Nocardia sp. NPDC051570]|uniref:WhiB family transcriptional regulator n=1 Tax=Nocardia sp. NPDC051570 TaxID=3364324 RepID=UPI0037AEDC3F
MSRSVPACAVVDVDFFPSDQAGVVEARLVCVHCPLLRACAQRTLAMRKLPTYGVFASVLMPAFPLSKAKWDRARAELERVARTGQPVWSGSRRRRSPVRSRVGEAVA